MNNPQTKRRKVSVTEQNTRFRSTTTDERPGNVDTTKACPTRFDFNGELIVEVVVRCQIHLIQVYWTGFPFQTIATLPQPRPPHPPQ